jgi:aminoglycoside 6'-N-acetyltransferase
MSASDADRAANTIRLVIPDRIETERLYLRPYRAGDGPLYHAVSRANRAHLARYESGNYLISIDSDLQGEAVVRELASDFAARKRFFLGAFDRISHAWVGQVYVGNCNWDLPEFTVGYIVDCEHEGQGYVTEAVQAMVRWCFRHLGAYRLRLSCDDTNVRSYRVAERCGFVREGHLRENHKHADGSITGTLLYGLLRSEYQEIGGWATFVA